jgi:hypothetical protein
MRWTRVAIGAAMTILVVPAIAWPSPPGLQAAQAGGESNEDDKDDRTTHQAQRPDQLTERRPCEFIKGGAGRASVRSWVAVVIR